ncbi:MAG: metallopeptidase TldD-related protein [Candidatus Acidiferrales bacterium]
MKKIAFAPLLLLVSSGTTLIAAQPRAKSPSPQAAAIPAGENDKTLQAMRDELERSRTHLQLPGVDKPFYIEYRLLDMDVRSVTASFGALLASDTQRSRFMSVDVRVGNYHLDSSNFISDDGFRGFLGSTGQVGIDRDYNSLRQDLWLATDQAYKAAVTQMSLKNAFLRSLTKPPEIDDFSQVPAIVKVDPRIDPDWTSRNWDNEARAASAALKNFEDIDGTRVNYYLIYLTSYLMTSEGTTIRTSKSVAAIEASLDTHAEDGMALHNYYATYSLHPANLPDPAAVSKGLTQAATDLMGLRASPLVPDFTGPVLFDAPAAASVLAQMLPASLSGARPPLSTTSAFDQMMQRVGANSEWSGRVGSRVLPTTFTVTDDPSLKDFQGQTLLGGYDVDDEGVQGQKVTVVEHGILRDLLMSRRPGPDFEPSNGHGRSADLSDTKPLSSNLLLQSSDALHPADLMKKFLDACRDDGHSWCPEVKRMDNPALSSVLQEDFSDFIGGLAGGISSGMRIPLLVYRVYVADGHAELVRGGIIDGLTLRSLRNISAAGDDTSVFTYMQNSAGGFAGSALGAFGSAQGGIPSTVIAPSLLLDEVEIRGFHGEPRRVPLVSAPPLK